ncbi:uncharacterized protein [Mytilus edulis]|uniref:uncharacterized protein n=1 Tax=Mytilus edulis TaxID=6550 RepID=UPI0039F0B612
MFAGVPDSKRFDVTLMITLLRHLTPMTPPAGGYDCLPHTVEVTQGADLARIKYYRNCLAHLDDGKIDTSFFNTALTDITDAIARLGGHTMEQECYQLKTKCLDYSNQEIVMNIKHSEDEIKEIKESLEEFKSSHLKLQKSHELLQGNYEEGTKRFSLLQEDHEEIKNSYASLQQKLAKSQQDTVPWNVRAQINKIYKKWKNNDKMFVSTRAAKHVLKLLQDNSCVTITASSGVGKTAILQHVALQMDANGYDIFLVTDPRDIIQYYNPNQKTLFVIDDLFGGFSLSQNDIKLWESISGHIKEIIEDNQTKIMVTCRLQVYQDNNFDILSIFNSSVCNLLSLDMCLTKNEKQSIAEVYLETKAIEISDYYGLYDCFPLLCQLYYNNPTQDIKHFFQHPYSVYEAQVDQLQKRCFGKYCALVLCVMFNNKLNEDMLTKKTDEEIKTIIENTCETCKLDRGTSRLFLKDEMESLLNTLLIKQDKSYPTTENNKLILKTKTFYTTIHDKIFHYLVNYFGQKIIDCLIKNADSCLIWETFLLERRDATDQFITIVPCQYHKLYMQRMTEDWSKGKLQDVFNNKNMKIHQFRQRFLFYLNTLDVVYQKQLVLTRDTNDKKCKRDMLYYRDDICDTVMLHCCSIGDMQMIQWCCKQGVDVNKSGICGQSPLMVACRYGHTDIVRMLLNKAADCNKCDEIGQSPTLMASIYGHTTIVRILMDNGADYSKCDNLHQSPLFMACKHDHTDIVTMLLDREANYKKI